MADVDIELRWLEGLRFEGGRAGGATVAVDGHRSDLPTPVELLLIALSSCIAADVVDIAGRMRVGVEALAVRAEGDRAAEPPRRYTRVSLRVIASGVAREDEPKLQRALDLSRERYCSVLHTLREDLKVDLALSLALEPA